MGTTIRAKMSDQATRAAHMNGMAAEREARAILAEAEPEEGSTAIYCDASAPWMALHGRCDLALAESLTAFTAAADVAAFLQVRQHVSMGERS